MTSSRTGIPRWFKLTCCAVPLAALLVATIGAAMGSIISPVVFVPITALSWRVISKVLGIKPCPIIINLPRRQTHAETQNVLTQR